MPKITIVAGATETIPGTQMNNIPATRKGLVFTLISGDAYWGWTDTVTAAGDTDAGIPMAVGSPVAMAGEHYDFSYPVRLFSPGGGVVNYQALDR